MPRRRGNPRRDGRREQEQRGADDGTPAERNGHWRRIYGWNPDSECGTKKVERRDRLEAERRTDYLPLSQDERRRSQVVRQETANLPFVGSIPTGASRERPIAQSGHSVVQ